MVRLCGSHAHVGVLALEQSGRASTSPGSGEVFRPRACVRHAVWCGANRKTVAVREGSDVGGASVVHVSRGN